MLFFTNRELAETYHVSDRTIRNWIDETKRGKLHLVLHEANGRAYIANTTQNLEIIEELVAARKKFRPHHTFKVITPRREFYELYLPTQIYDIVLSMEIHREVPRQYNYFDGGAVDWDKYVRRLAGEEAPNILTRTIELLDINQSYIDDLTRGKKHVNVVDVGVGNALPVRDFLAHLVERGVMARYIALDISPEMLKIAERNITKWFGGKVAFEGHALDITYDRFANILAEEYLKKDAEDTVNLILVFGGTLGNLRNPDGAFRVIHDSMGLNDLLIHCTKLDTQRSRRYFDFNSQPGSVDSLGLTAERIFENLNIDRSLYDIEMGFDEQTQQRYMQVRLKVAITMRFVFDEGERLIDFHKNDTILVWRNWQQSATDIINQFDRNDFYLLHTSQTIDQEYILTVSRVKSETLS